MPIPEFFNFIRPALELHNAGLPVKLADVEVHCVTLFQITSQEREEMIPSGRCTRLYSRVQWALTYLRQAELIKSVGYGVNQITPAGLQYLPVSPPVIKPIDLKQFPAFVAFQSRSKSATSNALSLMPSETAPEPHLPEQATPEEIVAETYGTLRESLAQEVLERVKAMPPAFFERLIVQLMLRLGYGGGASEAGEAIGKSGDGGVDGVISEDKLGLDKIYLQAKRWDTGTVGSKDVQAFVGALSGQGASKGVFITTSAFSKQAKEYVRNTHNFKVSLIEGIELARLMIDYDLGVSLVQRYDVKRIDSDFFSDIL